MIFDICLANGDAILMTMVLIFFNIILFIKIFLLSIFIFIFTIILNSGRLLKTDILISAKTTARSRGIEPMIPTSATRRPGRRTQP